MASIRTAILPLATRSICRQCSYLTQRRTLNTLPFQRSLRTPSRLPRTARASPIRCYSTPESASKLYSFQDIQSISSEPSPQRILIDVREPSEVQEGYIPNAINIPIKTQPDALFLAAEEFEDRFGFQKPDTEAEVIFYCRAGVRAVSAAELARQNGYEKIGEYRGSWLDWEKNGGVVVKP